MSSNNGYSKLMILRFRPVCQVCVPRTSDTQHEACAARYYRERLKSRLHDTCGRKHEIVSA